MGLMARNSSGTYSLPASVNPVTTATTITSAWANTTLPDIAAEITDSLSRSGEGAMLAPLRVPDGSVFAPSVTFDSDQNTGLCRSGADEMAAVAGGTAAAVFGAGALTAPGTLAVASTLAVTGASTLTGAVAAAAGITATQSSSNAVALTATGNGTAAAAKFHAGTASTATDPTVAVELMNGHLKLSGTNPNSNEGFANTLTPMNVPKAWARITTDGVGGVSIASGFNVASVATGVNVVDVTLTTALANTTSYAAVVTGEGIGTTMLLYGATMTSTTGFRIGALAITTAPGVTQVDFQTSIHQFYFVLFGAQ